MLTPQIKATTVVGKRLHFAPTRESKTSGQESSPVDGYVGSSPQITEAAAQETKERPPVLKRLRLAGVRYALRTALALSSLGPAFVTSTAAAQNLDPTKKNEKVLYKKASTETSGGSVYQVSARDFSATVDSVKTKKLRLEKLDDAIEVAEPEDNPTLLGYELDTRFARISASPRYSDGLLKAKVKASAVRFSAKKEWTLDNGTQVRRGFSSRLRYEGEASLGEEQGFEFRSKHVDAELGLEQRYDRVLADNVGFSHRYFVGGRYRYRFGEQEGSEFRAVFQTEQKMYRKEAFQMFGQDFGWEARARQTFETNWGRVDGNGSQAHFNLEGLITKDVDLKLLGKKRRIKLKAGPEIKYSTRGAWSIGPEFGVKVRL